MDETKPLGVALLGLGRVAFKLEDDPLRNKPCTHFGAWSALPHVEIVAACDLDEEARDAFHTRVPSARIYSDYQQMFMEETLDAVSICAYADLRRDMVVAAAESGVKGIWCEKAMASSLNEAEDIAKALSDNDSRMIVSFMRRWSPSFLDALARIKAGEIGRLQTMNLHFSGNFVHTGTHGFDILGTFAGNVVGVQGWLESEGVDVKDSGYAFGSRGNDDVGGNGVVFYENGVKAFIHGQRKNYFRFELELLGEDGMIRIGNTQYELWLRRASKAHSGFYDLFKEPLSPLSKKSTWLNAVENLVATMHDHASPLAGVEQGKEALAVALAMHESHRQGHRYVALADVDPELRIVSR